MLFADIYNLYHVVFDNGFRECTVYDNTLRVYQETFVLEV